MMAFISSTFMENTSHYLLSLCCLGWSLYHMFSHFCLFQLEKVLTFENIFMGWKTQTNPWCIHQSIQGQVSFLDWTAYYGSTHSTWLYITLPWLHFSPLESTLLYYGSISLYVTLLHSTSLLTVLPWFYFTLLDSILVYIGSTSLYFSPHNSQCMALLYSTWFYITLHWLYITPLHSN